MSITLSERLSERLEKAANDRGTSVEAMLEEMLGPPFVVDEVVAVQEALEQAKQGRYRPLTEWLAEHKSRYPDPENSDGNKGE